MIYTKTPDKRKKTGPDMEYSGVGGGDQLITSDVLHSDPLKVSDHVNETLQILRNVLEGDYAAISKRLATGMMSCCLRLVRYRRCTFLF